MPFFTNRKYESLYPGRNRVIIWMARSRRLFNPDRPFPISDRHFIMLDLHKEFNKTNILWVSPIRRKIRIFLNDT